MGNRKIAGVAHKRLFNLIRGPRMFWLGQPVVDVASRAGIFEGMCPEGLSGFDGSLRSDPRKLDHLGVEFSVSDFPGLVERGRMKASNFSDAQRSFILKQGADGVRVADICSKAGISSATYFNWKKKYDGLLPTEMRRLKLLEDENTKLRKLVADLSLDREMRQGSARPWPKAAQARRTSAENSQACSQAQAGRRDSW